MVIQVKNLTKRYGPAVAVDGISFEVEKAEIVGFLGPNGAGKTTTMRILTCFLPATDGTASVLGRDVFTHSIEVRRNIGYMPEGVPMYPEMRVREYLKFRATIKGVPRRDRRNRVGEAMERCAVTDVSGKLIGALSKGYRQRVGLADALLAEPPLLVLDEPTIGLDPNQVRAVRKMIRDLGDKHTILISTHILSEVDAVCSRALIINRGRIVYNRPIHDVARQSDDEAVIRVEARAPAAALREAVAALKGVASAEAESERDGVALLAVRPHPGSDPRERISNLLAQRGWPLRELRRERVTLEDLFARITMGEEPTGAAP